MSFYLQANAYLNNSFILQSSLSSCSISNSTITNSSIDMNFKNITSVLDPINLQDAATKKYVDDLGIIIQNINLNNTTSSLIHTSLYGSFIITVTNNVLNGPSAIFHISKNTSTVKPHISRTISCNGLSSQNTLYITWNENEGIYLYKTLNTFNGSYKVKII